MERGGQVYIAFCRWSFSGDNRKGGFKDAELEMCPPIEQELSSRQLDGSLETGVEMWLENTNFKVISMHIAFQCQRNR